jgi:hypothetical protein
MTPLMADRPTGSGDSGRRSGDKARLSPRRRRRTIENDEYGEFIRRILRAYSRRVADGDVEALSLMTGLADELDNAIAQAVKGLRAQGYSWTEIGDRLGVTRQAARQRWTGR